MQAGQEVFAADDAEQACGTVASAAQFQNSSNALLARWWGIVSMQISASEQALHLGHAKGPLLQVSALPYTLLEDI
jgi:hypothetical protein